MNRNFSLTLAAMLAAGGGSVLAQSNTISGLDLALEDTWELRSFRPSGSGTYPNGVAAFGTWTTCCNPGSVAVQFQAAMDARHAFIHYLVAREANGRLEQISNYSHVKHTFGSSNDPSSCGTCAGSGRFSWVEVGCSDTYASIQAVDHFNLGPASEIDPWLGTWVPQCSVFDSGDPQVGGGQLCDGNRSLTQNQANALNNTIHNQMVVRDQDLLVPGALYYYQSGYLVPGEADANRLNNLGSRRFTATFDPNAQLGPNWAIADASEFLGGTILHRWNGSSLSSGANGTADGRFFVAVKVTGPTNGIYHYEYAVQNRDNKRGLGAFRIPVCPTARVTNLGFRDIDQDPLNQWTANKVGSEIVFTGNANPLRWDSIFNFWFDCDAAPTLNGTLSLDQYDIGPGAATVLVNSRVPGGLYNEYLGAGCGQPTAPTMYAAGSPDHATLPNPSFELRSKDNPPSSLCVFAYSTSVGTTTVAPGCTVYSSNLASMQFMAVVTANGSGLAVAPQPVPNTPAFEGLTLDVQAANLVLGGAWLGEINLSNGLRLRLGNQITGCP